MEEEEEQEKKEEEEEEVAGATNYFLSSTIPFNSSAQWVFTQSEKAYKDF